MAASRTATRGTAAPIPRRISFAKIKEPLEVPELLALQTDSFNWLIGQDAWRARVEADVAAAREDVSRKSRLEGCFGEI